MSKLPAPSPGEILLEEFGFKNLDIEKTAKKIGVNFSLLSDILESKAPITKETAKKLSIYFKTSIIFWLRLQKLYDKAKEFDQYIVDSSRKCYLQ
jgi:antitoxin HigA-1